MTFDEIVKLISMILGVLGFVISVYNLILGINSKRRKLEINISDFRLANFFDDMKFAVVWIDIENLSQLPIAITKITLLIRDKKYNAYNRPHKIFETTSRTGHQITSSYVTYSAQLPINLSSLGAFSGDLGFQVPQGILQEHETHLTFEIGTNRGKAFQKTFELHETSRTPEYHEFHT